MKKYIRPEIKVRVLENENILAASGLAKQNDGTWVEDIDVETTAKVKGSAALSKQGSVWDDEDE